MITDRALRYRAQKNAPPGPRVCAYCGSDAAIDVEHIDGREENGNPENLTFACRSCNSAKGAYFARIGLGRKTRQYNPAPGMPARSVTGYVRAVLATMGADGGALNPATAVRTLQATPQAQRVAFARSIADTKIAGAAAERNPEPPVQFLWAIEPPPAIRQRNPQFDASQGAQTLEQWELAVGEIYHRDKRTGRLHSEERGKPAGQIPLELAIELIRNTPAARRSTYAHQIWARRQRHSPGRHRSLEEVPF